MIHTGEFFVMMDSENEEDIKTIEMFKQIKVYASHAFRIVCRKTRISKYDMVRLHIYVDFIELLNKVDIVEEDVDEIISKVRYEVGSIICNNDFELILSRLDYRFDSLIEDKNERQQILKLLKKSMASINYMKKINKYKNSIRFFSRSRSDNIYDKEVERLCKNKKIKQYEKNVLRFEAQVKNEHIKYQSKKLNISRSIEEYFTYQMYKKYMKKMIISVVGKGNFYSLREAEKIIKSSDLRNKDKIGLREFLLCTSQNRNLSKTKEVYGKYKFNKYISILELLEINPIIIPEKWRVKKIINPLTELIDELGD